MSSLMRLGSLLDPPMDAGKVYGECEVQQRNATSHLGTVPMAALKTTILSHFLRTSVLYVTDEENGPGMRASVESTV